MSSSSLQVPFKANSVHLVVSRARAVCMMGGVTAVRTAMARHGAVRFRICGKTAPPVHARSHNVAKTRRAHVRTGVQKGLVLKARNAFCLFTKDEMASGEYVGVQWKVCAP